MECICKKVEISETLRGTLEVVGFRRSRDGAKVVRTHHVLYSVPSDLMAPSLHDIIVDDAYVAVRKTLGGASVSSRYLRCRARAETSSLLGVSH